MLPGKNQPEDEQVGIEDPLLDIIEEVNPRHVEGESEVLHRQVKEGECEPQRHQALLQQVGAARQQPDAAPEPPELRQDDGEEDGLERDPDLGRVGKKSGLKKNQPRAFFLFFCWFFLVFFFIYICPEERVFRVFQFQEYF